MRISTFRNLPLIISLIGGNAYAQAQLPKCVLFGFGNCIGTLRFSNGDIYTGEFNYGKPSGKGAFAYGNGDSYSGTVVEGQRHGSGTYTSAAGDKYVGQFSEGKFEGVGTYYFLANNRSKGDVYVGEFSSNTFNGQGRYTHANGQVFVGSFVNGRKAVPIVAPETLLAQAEVQRLAQENAKQKAQLESQLEAERRERLAREKQAAAALVAQAEAQRIAEENAKQKAKLESKTEVGRNGDGKVPTEILGKWKKINQSTNEDYLIISKDKYGSCSWFEQSERTVGKGEWCVSNITGPNSAFERSGLAERVGYAFYKQIKSLENDLTGPLENINELQQKISSLVILIKTKSEFDALLQLSNEMEYWTIITTDYENIDGLDEISYGSGDCSYYNYITHSRLYAVQDCLMHLDEFNISVYEKE